MLEAILLKRNGHQNKYIHSIEQRSTAISIVISTALGNKWKYP